MRPLHLVFLLVVLLASACGDVPIDDERADRRLFPPRGVVRGTVTYEGPRPCSRDGHIVGNAIVLVFDRRNPPPPQGFATSALNFVAVPGDVLFTNEPRSTGKSLSCPAESETTITSAPFTIAPLEAGSYVLAAFYDRRGRFSPSFKFRNLPESGDLSGGYVDLGDARRNAQNPNYQPIFLPVDVGVPVPNEAATPNQIPDFSMPAAGFVADNVPVAIGMRVPFTRPYFHPEGSEVVPPSEATPGNERGDPLAVPIVTMTQDMRVLAPPTSPTPATLTAYQASFRSLKVVWGVAAGEEETAVDPTKPFGLQILPLPPVDKGGLLVFSQGKTIPDNRSVPALWPQVGLLKLADDPSRTGDPQSLVVQGTLEESAVTGKSLRPLVALQGITLQDDSLAKTIVGPLSSAPTTAALRDHVTVLLRPAVLCVDPRRVDVGGILVTPHLVGKGADGDPNTTRPLFDAALVSAQPGVREVRRGCLPKGRYAISLVYPSGQAWTVPNEIGACAAGEGSTSLRDTSATCTTKPRPVLLSQGPRAVLEIVPPNTPEGEATCAENPVPDECTKL